MERRQPRFVSSAIVLLLLCCVLACGSVSSRERTGTQAPSRQAKRVLVVSLDGLDARYLNRRDEYGLKIPTLRRLMAEGVTARGVVSVYPSVTYPAHTTMVTGATPLRHGIFGNEMFVPLGAPQSGELQWFTRFIRADTLWGAAARSGLSTGMVSWPVAGGAGDYNVPEIFKPGGSQQETLGLMVANARPRGLVQEVAQRDPSLYSNVTRDESDDMRTRFAEYIIREKRPAVMLVHLFDLDHFEHESGPFTPQAFAALEKSDGYVSRLLAAAERAGTLAETAVFIVSDHGFRPISKQIHPGVVLARAGLLKIAEEKDAQGRARTVITDWRALPYVTGGSCAIILRDPRDRDALNRARAALKDLMRLQGRDVFRLLGAREAKALGVNPRARLMLEAAEGYGFGKNYTGEPITTSRARGQHGYLPSRGDYRASFIASGAGVTRRGQLGLIRMIDVGPTIARMLRLTLRDAEGQALKLN